MRPLWILLFAGALLACAPPQEKLPGDRAIAVWVGQPIAAVVSAWGEPGEIRQQSDVTLYVYQATQYRPSSGAANLPPETTTYAYRNRAHLACRGVFFVDDQGLVIDAEWRGYECWAMP